jgi:HD-GYP domain-containing protein (c-di-GMP phosphodiesterase class II)
VLDKPGKLDADEWAAVQAHAAYTETILSRIDAFSELAAFPPPTTSGWTARAIRAA